MTNLTTAELNSIFTNPDPANNPTIVSGVPIIACGIQTGSGTYASWNTVPRPHHRAPDPTENASTSACRGLATATSDAANGRLQENYGSGLTDKGHALPTTGPLAGAQVIVGFSAVQLHRPVERRRRPTSSAGADLARINGNAPSVTGTHHLPPSATFYASDQYGRDIYNVAVPGEAHRPPATCRSRSCSSATRPAPPSAPACPAVASPPTSPPSSADRPGGPGDGEQVRLPVDQPTAARPPSPPGPAAAPSRFESLPPVVGPRGREPSSQQSQTGSSAPHPPRTLTLKPRKETDEPHQEDARGRCIDGRRGPVAPFTGVGVASAATNNGHGRLNPTTGKLDQLAFTSWGRWPATPQCAGDTAGAGYNWSTFMVPASAPTSSTLTFNPVGPEPGRRSVPGVADLRRPAARLMAMQSDRHRRRPGPARPHLRHPPVHLPGLPPRARSRPVPTASASPAPPTVRLARGTTGPVR